MQVDKFMIGTLRRVHFVRRQPSHYKRLHVTLHISYYIYIYIYMYIYIYICVCVCVCVCVCACVYVWVCACNIKYEGTV